MKIEIEITSQRLADILTSAIECNDMTTAWCGGVLFRASDKVGEHHGAHGWWYGRAEFFEGDYSFTVDDAEDGKSHTVTPDKMKAGLELMAKKHGRHFGDFMAENDDSVTADVFLQLISIGTVEYG